MPPPGKCHHCGLLNLVAFGLPWNLLYKAPVLPELGRGQEQLCEDEHLHITAATTTVTISDSDN